METFSLSNPFFVTAFVVFVLATAVGILLVLGDSTRPISFGAGGENGIKVDIGPGQLRQKIAEDQGQGSLKVGGDTALGQQLTTPPSGPAGADLNL